LVDSRHAGFRNGTPADAIRRSAVQQGQASALRFAATMSETFINLGPYAFVRVELLAMSPTGPYRLTTEHPARRLVEYFEDAAAALVRRGEIESTFGGSLK
jgi:hypothetical protein